MPLCGYFKLAFFSGQENTQKQFNQQQSDGLVTLTELSKDEYQNGITDFEVIHAIKPYSNENEDRQLDRPMKMKYPSSNLEEPVAMEEQSVEADGVSVNNHHEDESYVHEHENEKNSFVKENENDIELPDNETIILERKEIISEEVDPDTSDVKAVSHTTITMVSREYLTFSLL